MKNLLASLVLAMVANTALADDMTTAFHQACSLNQCTASNVQREVIGNGIVHYSATLRLGPGEHDVIGIDRVVKETAPGKPKSTAKSVFLAHGDTLNFRVSFLIGPDPAAPLTSSFAADLAARNFDVWGLTQRWAMVPAGTITPADPTSDDFMQDWDMDQQVSDTRLALRVARFARSFTGSGGGKMPFLGWSRGGQTGYILAGVESQLPPAFRSVKALAVLDVPLKTDDTAFQNRICTFVDDIEGRMAAGIYADTGGSLVQFAGMLADVDPDGASPIVPGLTNYQVALTFGAATHVFITNSQGEAYVPWYHLVGGEFEGPVPTDLLFSDPDVFIDVMQAVSPYEALGVMYDGDRALCEDTEYDDHLEDIKIPVMYIGAQGGFGDLGFYTLSLLGSDDVEIINIEITGVRFNDFGHDDVIRSPLANDLWWDAFAAWLNTH